MARLSQRARRGSRGLRTHRLQEGRLGAAHAAQHADRPRNRERREVRQPDARLLRPPRRPGRHHRGLPRRRPALRRAGPRLVLRPVGLRNRRADLPVRLAHRAHRRRQVPGPLPCAPDRGPRDVSHAGRGRHRFRQRPRGAGPGRGHGRDLRVRSAAHAAGAQSDPVQRSSVGPVPRGGGQMVSRGAVAGFDLGEGIAILERTPGILGAWLTGLPDTWTRADEGPDTWCAFDVVGHLIDGEETDWIPRAKIILAQGEDRRFVPFDRLRHLKDRDRVTLADRLERFARLRAANLDTLRGWALTPAELALTGIHPEFGDVTLTQLLATWVAHDLDHLMQIARVMGRRYQQDAGPWRAYLRVLQ